jgi:CRP-like cAMP-binding protein
LLQLHRKQTPNDNIRISREELASIAGSSTESLIRTLSDFKREWLIETDGREIKILNPFGLERIRKFS